MEYIDALEKSTGWIYKYYREFAPKDVEFDDYHQECMLYFWGTLKPRFSAELCWGYSKIAYKRVMVKMLYRANSNKIKAISLKPIEEYISSPNEEIFEWSIKLKPHLQEVAELIADGYETQEICDKTKKTKQTIYTYIKCIKKQFAEFLGIEDYQRKHLRNFTRKRTQKELEVWEKSKARLKAVQELRKRVKSLPIQEKSRQCVI